MLRDDKTYPYIKVTVREAFPRIFMTRQMKKDKAKYFGPFSSAQSVRKTLDFMYRAFQLRDCKRVLPRDIGKERPCLNYHIHQCGAPCAGYMGEAAYRENVDAALDFLNGRFAPVVKKLQAEMEAAALYTLAAQYGRQGLARFDLTWRTDATVCVSKIPSPRKRQIKTPSRSS